MPKRRPSRGSVEGTPEGRMQNRSPYCADTQHPKMFFERYVKDVPESNVAVHRKRHRIHELGRVGHQREQRDSEELLVDA